MLYAQNVNPFKIGAEENLNQILNHGRHYVDFSKGCLFRNVKNATK